MHHLDLILTLTASLSAALVFGYVAFRLKLSPIVRYLLAGFVVGPATPGFVSNSEIAEQFAEIGVNPLEQWLLRVVPSLQSTAVHAVTDCDHVEISSGTDRH